MNLSTILSRCQQNAEKWEAQAKELRSVSHVANMAAQMAARDWRSLEKEIGEELDREQAWLLKEQGNAPPPSSAE